MKTIQTQKGTYTYNYTEELGRGTYGSVYLGKNNQTGETVAVKLIDIKQLNKQFGKKMVEQIGKEANILQNITTDNQTPYIVKIYDCCCVNDHVIMVLEYCNQGTLEDKIKQKRTEKEANKILYQLAKGLESIHSKGITHRDLKPDNIFLKNGQYKLGDFGFATEKDRSLKTLCGTPAYIAPEILSVDPKYTQKIDMWALGVIYYQLLHSGQLPFKLNGNLIQLTVDLKKFNINRVLRNSKISQQSQNVLKQLLEKNANKRISSTTLVNQPLFSSVQNFIGQNQDNVNSLQLGNFDNLLINKQLNQKPVKVIKNQPKKIPIKVKQNVNQYENALEQSKQPHRIKDSKIQELLDKLNKRETSNLYSNNKKFQSQIYGNSQNYQNGINCVSNYVNFNADQKVISSQQSLYTHKKHKDGIKQQKINEKIDKMYLNYSRQQENQQLTGIKPKHDYKKFDYQRKSQNIMQQPQINHKPVVFECNWQKHYQSQDPQNYQLLNKQKHPIKNKNYNFMSQYSNKSLPQTDTEVKENFKRYNSQIQNVKKPQNFANNRIKRHVSQPIFNTYNVKNKHNQQNQKQYRSLMQTKPKAPTPKVVYIQKSQLKQQQGYNSQIQQQSQQSQCPPAPKIVYVQQCQPQPCQPQVVYMNMDHCHHH